MHVKIATLQLLFLLTGSLVLQAQPNKFGVPLITNYPYSITGGSEQNWCITQDHRGVVYVGNMDKGVLEYDGVEWRTIPVPDNAQVWSMVTGDDGVIYVGLDGDFGRLEPNKKGKLEFNSLCSSFIHDSVPEFSILKTYFEEGNVIFCSAMKNFIYNPPLDTVFLMETPENPYLSYFEENVHYHSSFGQGLLRHNGETYELMPGGDYFIEKSITGLQQYDDTHLLISTFYNGLVLYDMETGIVNDSFVERDLMENFRQAFIPFMSILNDNILVGTVYNGLYILDMTGRVKEIISEAEGLIQQTIAHAYSDERLRGSGPLWIANWRGISKVEANNPFRVFTEKLGFKGLILDIIYFNGRLYISTDQGLYFKSSSPSSTRFMQVPDIQAQIWDMLVMVTASGKSLLLASSDEETYVIDQQHHISMIHENLINPPSDPYDLEEFGGRYILGDPEKPGLIYTGYGQVVGIQYQGGRWKEVSRFRNLGDEAVRQKVKDKYGYLWVSKRNQVFRLDLSLEQESTQVSFTTEKGLPHDEDNTVFVDPKTGGVVIGTRKGFYRYNYFRDTLTYDSLFNSMLPPGTNYIQALYIDRDGDYWISFENQHQGWTELVARRTGDRFQVISAKPFQRLSAAASADVFCSDPEKGVWFSKSDKLYHFDKTFSRNDTLPFQTLIRKVVIGGDSVLYYGSNFKENGHGGYSIHLFQEEDTQPYIRYRFNNIEFHWAAPYFEQEMQLEYSYRLVGFSDAWSDWYNATFKEFTNLKFGRYTLAVKAKNVYGYESEPASYSFVINRPWYATIPAIIAYVLLSGLLVYVIIKLYTRRLKQENIRLEGIIEERTAEIRKQKEELTDSIEYASRIQRALLPSDELMEEHNIDHFILFRPRDIVSGDFYWMGAKNDKVLIVAADCTGHGVPGAFMSMLGMTFLDEIVIKSEITATDEIMEALREQVITSLEQSGRNSLEAIKDGMDLAMISVDMNTQKIQYSGAYNPLYLVRKLKRGEKTKLRNGEELDLPRGSIHDDEHLLLQIKADQMPIGASEKNARFSETTLKNEGFSIYMFSDGFLDQFGGPQGKKFMSKNFKKLLLELQSVPMKEQGKALEKVLLGWMGEISQIDDILVMGLTINPR